MSQYNKTFTLGLTQEEWEIFNQAIGIAKKKGCVTNKRDFFLKSVNYFLLNKNSGSFCKNFAMSILLHRREKEKESSVNSQQTT